MLKFYKSRHILTSKNTHIHIVRMYNIQYKISFARHSHNIQKKSYKSQIILYKVFFYTYILVSVLKLIGLKITCPNIY